MNQLTGKILGVRRLVAAFPLADSSASQDAFSIRCADRILANATATSRLNKAETSLRTPESAAGMAGSARRWTAQRPVWL